MIQCLNSPMLVQTSTEYAVLWSQVKGTSKAAAEKREEIFSALLLILRFDPPNSRDLGEAELLRAVASGRGNV